MEGLAFYAVLLLISVLLFRFTVVGFYVRAFYFGLCLIIGGFIGGIVSLPNGKTTDNHFRMFKIFQFMLLPIGIKYKLRNSKKLSDPNPYIVVANHQSAIDVLGMSLTWPVNCVVMLKSSLKFLPGFNLCAYLCESVYINRFSKEKATQTVDSTLNEIVSKKRKVWIYPEGTRNPEHELLPFKKGAFILAKKANIPVVPIVFSSHSFFYSFAEKRFTGGTLLIDVLPEIDTTKFETGELSDHCRDIMQKYREKLDKEAATLNQN